MEKGEQFTFVDVRNPQAWADSDVMAPGAIRVRLDNPDLPEIPGDKPIVTYCT
jgi:rhodanese-related sulfurtransferase